MAVYSYICLLLFFQVVYFYNGEDEIRFELSNEKYEKLLKKINTQPSEILLLPRWTWLPSTAKHFYSYGPYVSFDWSFNQSLAAAKISVYKSLSTQIGVRSFDHVNHIFHPRGPG